jgi:hypothetical protein
MNRWFQTSADFDFDYLLYFLKYIIGVTLFLYLNRVGHFSEVNRWLQISADFDFDFLLYFSNISALPYSCIWIELDIFQRLIGDYRPVRILILIFCYTSQRYRLYLILVFESSWDIFQRWIGDYRPVRILILIFCYTSQINRRFLILIFESSWTFFRDRDSMLYKSIWSRFLGSVQGLHGPLGTNGFSWSSSPVMGTTQILALSSRIRILFQDESGSWRNRPCKCREFVRNLLKNKKTTMFVKCHVQRSFPLFSFATWM